MFHFHTRSAKNRVSFLPVAIQSSRQTYSFLFLSSRVLAIVPQKIERTGHDKESSWTADSRQAM